MIDVYFKENKMDNVPLSSEPPPFSSINDLLFDSYERRSVSGDLMGSLFHIKEEGKKESRIGKCANCGLEVGSDEIKFLDQFYHNDCFLCQGCGKKLSKDMNFNSSGSPSCENCLMEIEEKNDVEEKMYEMNENLLVENENGDKEQEFKKRLMKKKIIYWRKMIISFKAIMELRKKCMI